MKPASVPNVPGTTEAERFDNAVRAVFYCLESQPAEGRGETEGGEEDFLTSSLSR